MEALRRQISSYIYNGQNNVITPHSDLKQYPNVERLNFSNYGLTSLPPDIYKLRHLKSLDISNNKIALFPVELAQLPLRELNYEGNPFAELEPFHSLRSNIERIGFLKSLRGHAVIPPVPFFYEIDPIQFPQYQYLQSLNCSNSNESLKSNSNENLKSNSNENLNLNADNSPNENN